MCIGIFSCQTLEQKHLYIFLLGECSYLVIGKSRRGENWVGEEHFWCRQKTGDKNAWNLKEFVLSADRKICPKEQPSPNSITVSLELCR